MPPSPGFRSFSVGEPKAESHKRGRSLEGSLLFPEKDDDLTLFSEMQTKEREGFLLQSSDDFEDVFCNSSMPTLLVFCFSVYHLDNQNLFPFALL